ncbi:DJ-1/PfpI family protein [Duganella sp. FT3S]|uniref:DJ-1/PfpI family protein n=1 Tax=Rugamonas fusca TaxID=2758568 RepID=A0A7W2EGW0_9BURK|nr:DJ-1/PfpI family protein [Rugamonas fusca]MBA5605683.1 DJ-1/PfpI family protein [Rugamonas fusca]
MMNRRDLFLLSTAMGLAAALPRMAHARPQRPAPAPLPLPAEGSIAVAFVLSDDAVVIDFAGPWEVFENVSLPGRKGAPVFQLYTVAETRAPIKATGGMTIVPDYTFATAPAPKLIVIPAQSDPSEAMLAWIRAAAQTADLTMSVCLGAFLLARTGLLSGQAATTHHGAYAQFQMAFPDIVLKRGARYVESQSGKVASAGGLSSGIDLALRVVERYCGRDVALRTADHLEYQGQGWLHPDANGAYAKRRVSTDQHPCCVICEMDVEKATAPTSVYRGRTFYFCMAAHKQLFDANPARFLA